MILAKELVVCLVAELDADAAAALVVDPLAGAVGEAEAGALVGTPVDDGGVLAKVTPTARQSSCAKARAVSSSAPVHDCMKH